MHHPGGARSRPPGGQPLPDHLAVSCDESIHPPALGLGRGPGPGRSVRQPRKNKVAGTETSLASGVSSKSSLLAGMILLCLFAFFSSRHNITFGLSELSDISGFVRYAADFFRAAVGVLWTHRVELIRKVRSNEERRTRAEKANLLRGYGRSIPNSAAVSNA